MAEVYLCDWKKLGVASAFSDYLLLLPKEEREKTLRFVRNEDRMRCLAGLLLRRMAVSWQTGLVVPQFGAYAYGKPYVKDGGDFQFNVSHAGDLAVCACGNCAVGVDVERMAPVDWTAYRSVFSEQERKWLDAADDPLPLFYALWTVREAFAKKEGLGLPLFDTKEHFCYDTADAPRGGQTADDGGDITFLDKSAVSYGGRSAAAHRFCCGDYQIALCCDEDEEVRIAAVDAAEWERGIRRIAGGA